MNKKTIVIVDDHPLVREGLKSIIAGDGRYEVVAETGKAREALRLIRHLKPDLALVDLRLPDMTGIELTREIFSTPSGTRVMIISMHSQVDYIVKAFEAGATGYAVKDNPARRLLEGIRMVLNGEYFMDSAVSYRVVQKLMQAPAEENRITQTSYDSLTPREQEIMKLLAEGLTTKEIADRLFISPKTVENHRSNIMGKLDVHSYAELVRFAARLGLIDLDLWKE
jgi:DNA-binding NarL/FixJ family response regulator